MKAATSGRRAAVDRAHSARTPATDHFLTELSGLLRGPRRVRAELVVEIADGVDDARSALQDNGIPAAEAERRALAEFGTAREIAAGLRAALAAGALRRLAVLGSLLPVLILGWASAWSRVPDTAARQLSGTLTGVLYSIGAALAAISIAALVVHRGRRILDRRALDRCRRLSVVLAGGLAAFLSIATVLTALNWSLFTFTMSHGFAIAVSVASLVLVPALCWACVGATVAATGAPKKEAA